MTDLSVHAYLTVLQVQNVRRHNLSPSSGNGVSIVWKYVSIVRKMSPSSGKYVSVSNRCLYRQEKIMSQSSVTDVSIVRKR
jgi:hypothetical protein